MEGNSVMWRWRKKERKDPGALSTTREPTGTDLAQELDDLPSTCRNESPSTCWPAPNGLDPVQSEHHPDTDVRTEEALLVSLYMQLCGSVRIGLCAIIHDWSAVGSLYARRLDGCEVYARRLGGCEVYVLDGSTTEAEAMWLLCG